MIFGASETATAVDKVFFGIVGISVVLLLGITVSMIYFVFRFNRKKVDRVKNIHGNAILEAIWIVLPTVIVVGMFYYGYRGYIVAHRGGADVIEIVATGVMWEWRFTYPNGAQTVNDLYVPVDRQIRIVTRSNDVIHSFYIPAFRVKKDAVPGRENTVHFTAARLGSYDIFCAEYCGRAHADMIGKCHVLTEADFNKWLAENAPREEGTPVASETAPATGTAADATAAQEQPSQAALEPDTPVQAGSPEPAAPPAASSSAAPAAAVNVDIVARGERLAKDRGCFACHSTDGRDGLGPTFKGLYNSRVTVVVDGQEQTVTANEDYLRKAILEPNAQIVKGYQPIMPSQKGISTDEEINAMVAYIKSLR